MKTIFSNSKTFFLSVLILILLNAVNTKSQVSEEWVHRYTGPESSTDTPSNFVTDNSGNLYVTGKSIVGGAYYHIVTVKFNSSGIREWIATYNGGPNQNDEGVSIQLDGVGNVYVTGNIRLAGGQFNILLIKYNPSGIQQWTREYNGPDNSDDFATGCVTNAVGDIYVGGYSFGTGTGYDYALLKYDTGGNQKWVKRWNGTSNGDDYLKKIDLAQNGDIILAGYSYNSTSSNNFVTQRYNNSGTLIWSEVFNGALSLDDQVSDLKVDASDNIYVCGKSKGTGVGYNYATVKYNPTGVQQWAAIYNSPAANDDVANAIEVDAAGNVYTTGNSFNSITFSDYATVKYNSAGTQQWVRNFDGAQNYFDKASDVKVDNTGNVYVTGQSVKSSDGTSDLVTVKYNSAGTFQWSKLYNGLGNLDDIPVQLEFNNSNLFILGTSSSYFFGPFCGTSDYVIIKYNLSGDLNWEARYDGSGEGIDEGTALTVSGGFTFCTGFSYDNVSNFDYATIKYNSAGAPLWVTRYDAFGGSDKAASVATDNIGNTYVTGASQGNGSVLDIATVKYAPGGEQLWASRYNGAANGNDLGTNIAVDVSGNVYVCGYSDGSGSGKDYVTIKYNSSGSQQWAVRYNGPGNSDDIVSSMIFDPAGFIFVTGMSIGSGTLEDIATVKYNSSGSEVWASRFNGAANNSDESASIALDGLGNIIVTGKSKSGSQPSNAEISNYDIVTLKINSSGIQQWASLYNGAGNGDDEGSYVVTDNSGNIYVTGSGKGLTSDLDYVSIKYNSSGAQQWVSLYNGTSNKIDRASSLVIDPSGNLFVTGSCDDIGTNLNYCTIKYNNLGQQKWVKKYNYIDNDTDKASTVKVDTQGNVFVTGLSKGLQSNKDFTTIKYSQDKELELKALIEGFYDNVSNVMLPDTLRVYLRNSSSPYTIADSAVSLSDNTGMTTFNFFNAQNSVAYYLVLNHRNSIETWSSSTLQFTASWMSYDMTTASSQAYGNNLKLKGIKFCVYSGDVNKDGIVDASDGSLIDNDVYVFLSGRNKTDLNGDEIIDGSDLSIADNNALNFIGLIRP